MKELIKTDVQTMSSLEIAELTGKRHDNVVRDIKAMLNELGIGLLKFEESYLNSQNKEQPCFKLPRREVEILITGYSTVLRAKVIDRLKELEEQARKPSVNLNDPATLKQLLIDNLTELEAAQKQIEKDRPKVEFAMSVLPVEELMDIGQCALLLGYGRNTFLKMLFNDGYLHMVNRVYRPTQKYTNNGTFKVKCIGDKDGGTPLVQIFVTGKGLVRLRKAYKLNV